MQDNLYHEDQAYPKYRWVVTFVGFIASAVILLGWFSLPILVGDIQVEFNLTEAELGYLMSSTLLFITIFSLPAGVIGDKIGAKMAMGIGITLASIFCLLRGFASDYLTLMILTFLVGFGYTFYAPNAPKLVAGWFPRNKYATVNALIGTTGYCAGAALAFALTPMLKSAIGSWSNVFFTYGIMGLVGATLWWLLVKKPPAGYEGGHKVSVVESINVVWRSKQIRILTICYFLLISNSLGVNQWLPKILMGERSLPDVEVGFVSALLQGLFIPGTLLIAPLSDKIRRRKPFIILPGIVGSITTFIIMNTISLPLYISIFIYAIVVAGAFPISFSIVVEAKGIGEKYASTAMGFVHTIGHLGASLTVAIFGVIYSCFSLINAIIMLAAIIFLMAPLGQSLEETDYTKGGL